MTRAMPGQTRSVLPGLLMFGVCLLLALINWRLLNMEIDISAATLQDVSGEVLLGASDKTLTAPELAALEDFPETLARPLFRSDRRPPPVEQPQAARPRAPAPGPARFPEDIKLVGIIKESGKPELAMIRTNRSPFAQHIRVGEVVNGWRLSRIEPRSVFFESNGRKQRLSLFPQSTD